MGSRSMRMEHTPVAYVTNYAADLSDAQPANLAMSQAIQDAAGQRGWPMLGAHSNRLSPAVVVEQLRAASAWGVMLDTLEPSLLDAIRHSGLPLVMINSWVESAEVDVVLQDNYRGGFLAARHLVERGAKRVAWIGPTGAFCHSRERYAGAVAGLLTSGLRLVAEIETASDRPMDSAVKELLSRPDRPDGILSFWKNGSRALIQVSQELGLQAGQDFRMVGWTVEELYDSEHRAVFAGGPIPPAVVWPARAMVATALEMLEQRQKQPGRGTLRVNIPTRLRMGDAK